MELIDRYVYAVTKRIPQKQREDIEKELRTLIEDMLNERCGEVPPQKSDVESVLTELGNPSKLAAKYIDTDNYLISPEYFDTYIFVLKIVVSCVIFGSLIAKVIELLTNPPEMVFQSIGLIFAAILSGAFQGFTWVTVIFALNERFFRSHTKKYTEKDWSVSDLPEIPKKDEIIKPIDPILGIVFSVLFNILFIFGNQLIGAYSFTDGKLSTAIPVFSAEGIRIFLPLIITLFCLSIIKECTKLIIGRWNLTVGVVTTVTNIISLVLCIIIFTSSTIWNQNFLNDLFTSGIIPSSFDFDVVKMWDGIRTGFVIFTSVGLLIDSLVAMIKGIKYGK